MRWRLNWERAIMRARGTVASYSARPPRPATTSPPAQPFAAAAFPILPNSNVRALYLPPYEGTIKWQCLVFW